MILDSITHYDRYRGLSPRFARAFDYLQRLNTATADGRYEIEGELIHDTVMSYETKVPANLTVGPMWMYPFGYKKRPVYRCGLGSNSILCS